MGTSKQEQLRRMLIQRSRLEAEDPSLLKRSRGEHARLCDAIAAMRREDGRDLEYVKTVHVMELETREAA